MRRFSFFALFAAAVLVSAQQARADQISWSYDFSLSSTVVHSNADPDERGRIVLRTTKGVVTGDSTITAATLDAFSHAAPGDKAHFIDAEFTLIMHFTDLKSGLSAAVTFIGALEGTISSHSSSIHNDWIGPTEYIIDLGHHLYDIKVGAFAPPGIPGTRSYGSIDVNVKVRDNPEPTGLLLAGFGLPLLGLARRKR